MANNTIVIYHGGCRDGFCAAWVYRKYRNAHCVVNNVLDEGTVEYFPGFYGQEPPDVKWKNVVIVDFSYQLDTMLQIILDSKSLIWLDHHKTAEPVYINLLSGNYPNVHFRFDNNRSGAGLAWDYFFPNESRPWIVNYVEDRDLWLKKLNNTDVVNALIATLEFSFDVWDKASTNQLEDAVKYGNTALAKTEQYVREVCKNVYFRDIVDGGVLDTTSKPRWNNIPIVNICQVDCSEVLTELCKMYPSSLFTLYWFKRADGLYQYGLRSIGDFDVSAVAKLFGGGGHKNAAGFQLPYLMDELA